MLCFECARCVLGSNTKEMAGTDLLTWIADGQDPPAPHLAAVMLQAKGEDDQAEKLFTKLLTKIEAKEMKTNNDLKLISEYLTSIAEIHTNKEDYSEALRVYRRVLALHVGGIGQTVVIEQELKPQQTKLAELYSRIAEILAIDGEIPQALNNWQYALDAYTKAGLNLTANFADALFSLAILKEKHQKRSEAIELLEQALHVETTVFGEHHARTSQVERKLDELRRPLLWTEPDPHDHGCTVEALLRRR
jgi:tetratricopeptide (TPR) repeat protein